jgi:hypothetical protein
MADAARGGFTDRASFERGGLSRLPNIILGIWLFISAFVWHDPTAQFYNTWICGIFCFIFAIVAGAVPPVRWLNTLLAIWIFISAFALPDTSGTAVNNVIVAILVFIFSFVPNAPAAEAAPHEAPPPSVA